MVIKDGYGGSETKIKVFSTGSNDRFEVWVEQASKRLKGETDETLAYATTEELLSLRDEINKALRERLGL